jgi:hypothetical protein
VLASKVTQRAADLVQVRAARDLDRCEARRLRQKKKSARKFFFCKVAPTFFSARSTDFFFCARRGRLLWQRRR